MKQLEATHAMKMKRRMIPAMKSSLKATHAIKGNSKEVSQPGERLTEHKEGWRQEPRPCSATKPERHKKGKIICPLGAWTHRKAIWSVILMLAKHLNTTLNILGVMQGSQEGKRAKLWGPCAHFGANISMKISLDSRPQTPISFLGVCAGPSSAVFLPGIQKLFQMACQRLWNCLSAPTTTGTVM